MFDREKGPREPMNLKEARGYVKRNASLEPMPELPSPDTVECIDDRRGSRAIGYPGGLLGMKTTLFSSIDQDARKRIGGFGGFAKVAESLFGGMSAHTDDNNKHDPCGIAGCGHMQSIIAAPEAYSFGGEYVPELQDYSRDLKRRSSKGEPGINIFSYFGNHNARAIMDLEDPEGGHYIALPPNDGSDQVFVVNRGANKQLLHNAKKPLIARLGDVFKHDPRDVYDDHLALTANRLAPNLPQYRVEQDKGRIFIKD